MNMKKILVGAIAALSITTGVQSAFASDMANANMNAPAAHHVVVVKKTVIRKVEVVRPRHVVRRVVVVRPRYVATRRVVVARPIYAAPRIYVARERIFANMRARHYAMMSQPYFIRGHYVVRSRDRFGRIVLIEMSPRTGNFIGVFRI